MEIFDVTIFGGGSTGLYAAYSAGLRGLKTKIIDALPELGGQLIAIYPEKYIHDVAGFPSILARDLANNLIQQALQYHPEVLLDERIISMEEHCDNIGKTFFVLTTEKGNTHYSRTLLPTSGIGTTLPRRLNLSDVHRFEGKGVLYFVKDKEQLRKKNVLIVGGGDSAIDWVLNLTGYAKQITLIHRRDQFRAHEDSVKKVYATPTTVKLCTEVKAIHGNSCVETVTVVNNRTNTEEKLSVDIVLLNLGSQSTIGPLIDLGIATESNDVVVNSRMETNISGIYAAGDIVTYPGKLKLITTGFGEAATAINSIRSYLTAY
jgi:thioredoxin reductase